MKFQYLLFFAAAFLARVGGGGEVHAQCVNNLATMVRDTVLTGVGYGTYQIDLPAFPPDSGLLVSVTVNARVTLQYAFSMKNADVASSVYTLKVGREDQYSSPAMSAAYDQSLENQIGVYPMNPGQVVTQPSFAFLAGLDNKDSITGNVAPFVGAGRVHFTYSPVTWTTLHTNNNSSYNYSASAKDTTRFSVSYLYCRSGGVLNEGVMNFNARVQGAAAVELRWSPVFDVTSYVIERSLDGLVFVPVATLSGTEHLDRPGAVGIYYYRLKVGNLYSPVRQVELAPVPGFSVYPNPATDGVTLTLPNRGAWQVDMFAADGRLLQGGMYRGQLEAKINFLTGPAAGAYFLRAREVATGKMVCKPLSIK